VDAAFLSADAAWWSSLDLWMVVVVTIGVVVEGVAYWLPARLREAPLTLTVTRAGWVILVIALIGEYIAQHHKDIDDALIVETLKNGQISRAVDAATEDQLIKALAPFAGTKVRVTFYGGGDSQRYAGELAEALRKAKWDVQGSPVFGGITIPPTHGVQPTVSQRDVEANKIPEGAAALFSIFWKCGIVPVNQKWMNPEVPPDMIELRVGDRLPPDLLGPNKCSPPIGVR
jgi:hypothetical protein